MKNLLIATISLTIISSCNVATLTLNDDSNGGDKVETIEITGEFPESEEGLMTILTGEQNRAWKPTGFEIVLMSGFQDCRMDDLITLNNDGTYTYDGGTDLCGAEDDVRMKSGVWELDFDGQTIIFDKGSNTEYIAEIATATESKLILKGEYLGWDLIGRYEVNI